MVSVDERQRLCRCHFGRRRHHIRVDGWWLIAPRQFSGDLLAPIFALQKARIRNEDVIKRISHTWASAPSPFEPFYERLFVQAFFVSFSVANPLLSQAGVPRSIDR